LGVHAQAPFKGEIEIAAKLRDYNLEDYHPEKEGATLTSAEHRSNAITLGFRGIPNPKSAVQNQKSLL
jgi:hypothetical protein